MIWVIGFIIVTGALMLIVGLALARISDKPVPRPTEAERYCSGHVSTFEPYEAMDIERTYCSRKKGYKR